MGPKPPRGPPLIRNAHSQSAGPCSMLSLKSPLNTHGKGLCCSENKGSPPPSYNGVGSGKVVDER